MATCIASIGTAGGEAQQTEIRQLLKELELKKAKLNELKVSSMGTATMPQLDKVLQCPCTVVAAGRTSLQCAAYASTRTSDAAPANNTHICLCWCTWHMSPNSCLSTAASSSQEMLQ